VLLSRGLEPIVDMVGWSNGDGYYEVASADGAVGFRRGTGANGGFRIYSVTGQNPLAVQDQTGFVGLEVERAMLHPSRDQNSYRDDCAFFLVADDGMEESDPAVRGDWDVAFAEANVLVRDEGYGFLSLSGS
jgi:hypothetical protein